MGTPNTLLFAIPKFNKMDEKNTIYESQQANDVMSQAEIEEMIVVKRRAEGTPCTKENFLLWQQQLDDEIKNGVGSSTVTTATSENDTDKSTNKRTGSNITKVIDDGHKIGRLTGFQYFSDKTNNYEALEAAAERAENDATFNKADDDDNDDDVDEALFDDDVDMDDLSFDDEEDDDDEDEVNI
jgi:hypothetical protein